MSWRFLLMDETGEDGLACGCRIWMHGAPLLFVGRQVRDAKRMAVARGPISERKFLFPGGHIILTNEGSVLLGESASFEMEKGASMELQTGSINVMK